jgi:hypothetical protein
MIVRRPQLSESDLAIKKELNDHFYKLISKEVQELFQNRSDFTFFELLNFSEIEPDSDSFFNLEVRSGYDEFHLEVQYYKSCNKLVLNLGYLSYASDTVRRTYQVVFNEKMGKPNAFNPDKIHNLVLALRKIAEDYFALVHERRRLMTIFYELTYDFRNTEIVKQILKLRSLL